MASILRQLSDADSDAIHEMIRRDSASDLEIAREAEARLGRSLGPTNHARETVVHRYRRSRHFQTWLARRDAAAANLEKELALQRERFNLVSRLVQGGDSDGREDVSRALQARLLVLAAEANDAELKEAAGSRGWVAAVLKLQADEAKARRARDGEKAVAVVADKKLTPAEREARMKEIFGLA